MSRDPARVIARICRTSSRDLDVDSIHAETSRRCGLILDRAHVLHLVETWAHDDVACEECGGTGVVRGQFECRDCDGARWAMGLKARVVVNGARRECGFCGEPVQDGDAACFDGDGCSVEFVDDLEQRLRASVAAEE